MTRALLGACHPGPTVAVSVVAVLLGAGVGLGAGAVVVFGLAVLAGQLSVGWSNDAVDVARDIGAGRTDKPAASGLVSTRVLWWSATTAAAVSVMFSLALGWRAGGAQLLLPAAGWSYNVWLKATWASALAYVVGFGALAAAPYLALPGHPAPPWWAPVAGALLGVGAHVANVLPDLRDDAEAGVRGLPHRLGRMRSTLLMAATLVAAAAAVVLGPRATASLPVQIGGALAVIGAVASAAVAWRRPDSEAAFYGVVGVALLDAVLLVLSA